jgi:hypothetical protein
MQLGLILTLTKAESLPFQLVELFHEVEQLLIVEDLFAARVPVGRSTSDAWKVFRTRRRAEEPQTLLSYVLADHRCQCGYNHWV